MEEYIGVKRIKATPMDRLEYNMHRGWDLPKDEEPTDEGYLVEYIDSPNSNHKDHAGYISWSPKDVFERAYRRTDGMTFGLAIEAAKKGCRVARAGWNGKNMHITLCTPGGKCRPYLIMYDAQFKLVPWLASQTDMLADDWFIVD